MPVKSDHIMLMKYRFIFAAVMFTALSGFSKQKAKMYKIIPDQILEISKKFKIKHMGYGHRIVEADSPTDRLTFFEFDIEEITSDQSKKPERARDKIYLPLLNAPTMTWKNYVIHFTRCDENGPPHDNMAPVEFYIEELASKNK